MSAPNYLVIVHAAGQLDEDPSSYWTEVPALSACVCEASSVDEVVAATRDAIRAWLTSTSADVHPDFGLTVELAF
jgi:predicted RNase H-like HicB family nuclease